MTAGHCICSKTGYEDKKHHVPCLSPSVNQIRPENEIFVYGGSDYSKMKEEHYKYKWTITEAYHMEGSSPKKWDGYDIGIAMIPNAFPNEGRFFNKKDQVDRRKVAQADIIPVCLIDRGFDFTGETLTGIGWGVNYNEISSNPYGRDPEYSTCMTNEDSPKDSRFQNCDMKEIKKLSWECEKKVPPPNYNKDKCKRLFEKAATPDGLSKLALSVRSKLKRINLDFMKTFVPPGAQGQLAKNLENANVMHVRDADGNIEETCYQDPLLRDNGWCFIPNGWKLDKNVPIRKWGFCSPSCSSLLMKASSL